jgi:hypothetical protein
MSWLRIDYGVKKESHFRCSLLALESKLLHSADTESSLLPHASHEAIVRNRAPVARQNTQKAVRDPVLWQATKSSYLHDFLHHGLA